MAVRQYRPLASKDSLYRVVAAVVPTPDGVLAFAREYGRLGEDIETLARLPDGSRDWVEPLRKWRVVIAWLGEAVRLWDLAEEGNRSELAKVIRWPRKGVVRYQATRDF